MTPETLLRVFGPSSTSTDKTLILSGILGRLPEVVEALAQRDDGIDLGLGVDSEVDQERALGALGRIERRADLGQLVDAHRRQAVCVGELDEIGHVREVDLRADAAVEVVLELADHAE